MTFRQLLTEALGNTQFKRLYDALEYEFQAKKLELLENFLREGLTEEKDEEWDCQP